MGGLSIKGATLAGLCFPFSSYASASIFFTAVSMSPFSEFSFPHTLQATPTADSSLRGRRGLQPLGKNSGPWMTAQRVAWTLRQPVDPILSLPDLSLEILYFSKGSLRLEAAFLKELPLPKSLCSRETLATESRRAPHEPISAAKSPEDSLNCAGATPLTSRVHFRGSHCCALQAGFWALVCGRRPPPFVRPGRTGPLRATRPAPARP